MPNRSQTLMSGVCLSLALSFFAATSASAQATAAIKIDQISARGLGVWTLFTASGTTFTSKDEGTNPKSFSFALREFGPITLSIKSQAGMAPKIFVYRSGDLIKTVDSPAYSFNLFPNDNYRFLVQYSLARVGSLGITSSPSSVRFRMKGPNGKIYTAKTPHTFKNIPAGQYTVLMASTKTCLQPAPQTAAATAIPTAN